MARDNACVIVQSLWNQLIGAIRSYGSIDILLLRVGVPNRKDPPRAASIERELGATWKSKRGDDCLADIFIVLFTGYVSLLTIQVGGEGSGARLLAFLRAYLAIKNRLNDFVEID